MAIISVVIPTYNRTAYLKIALQSVLRQTFTDFEVIIQDNASPDDPGPMIDGLRDSRITLLRNASNIGQTSNIISSLLKAQTPFVAMMGDDDVWEPEYLETLLRPMLIDDSISLSFCAHNMIDAAGKLNVAMTKTISHRFGHHLLKDGVLPDPQRAVLVYRAAQMMSGAIVRRSAVDWDSLQPAPDLDMGVDIFYAYLAIRNGGKCHYTSRYLMSFRSHPGQQTYKPVGRDRLERARLGLAYWSRYVIDDKVKDKAYIYMACARKETAIIYNLLKTGAWGAAFSEFRLSVGRGFLRPTVIVNHINYLVRFHMSGIHRLVP